MPASGSPRSLYTWHLPTVHLCVAAVGYAPEMTDYSAIDERVEAVTHRLKGDLVDEGGRPAEPGEVERVGNETAKAFADAPVQEFVPLLIEHQARDELRGHGLRRDSVGDEPPDETADGAVETEGDGTQTAPVAEPGGPRTSVRCG